MSKTTTSRTKRTKAKDDGATVDPRLMKALSHPLRQRILQALNQRVASPAELSNELGESLGNVSYHVKILAELEAIELVRTAPVRGALEHFYRPLVRSYFDDKHWAQLPVSVRRALFDQTIQQIWDHLVDAANEEALDDPQDTVAWVDLEFDDEALTELNDEFSALLDRAMELQSEAVARLADLSDEERDAQAHRTELALMHFHRAGKTRVSSSKPRSKKRAKS
jgi:DNA-binding transcriptional ArsR family regulator